MDIDFVVLWVDGNDPTWQAEKNKYNPNKGDDAGTERYRELGTFRYWFRGVEKYAPWVRYVHFVTWGHIPEWLDTSNPKLRIVKHEDIMPQDILPTFNSNVIEMFLHKIPDLAEHFVYFNDDMYLIKDVKPSIFFQKEKPVDMLAFQPVIANDSNPVMSYIYMNNSMVLAKHFDKRQNVKAHKGNYFKLGYPPLYFFYNILELGFPKYTGFYTVHGPSAFLKRTYVEVWKEEEEYLNRASKNRFRSQCDVSQYLFREWQKLSNNFVAKNVQRNFAYFELGKKEDKLVWTIEKQKKYYICINDGNIDCPEETMEKVHSAFQKLLPNKCSFEV